VVPKAQIKQFDECLDVYKNLRNEINEKQKASEDVSAENCRLEQELTVLKERM
jgi:hypothetical protein